MLQEFLKMRYLQGLGGLRNEHLRAADLNSRRETTPSAADAVDNLWAYANKVVQVALPDWFYRAWVVCRLVPANKADPDDIPPGSVPDCRPVNIGTAEQRLIGRSYLDEGLIKTFNSILGPVQNGVGIKNGISITAFGVSSVLEARPDFACFQGDIKNGFNEVKRKTCIDSLIESGKLDHTLVFFHSILSPMAYIGMGFGTNVIEAPFVSAEGVPQGAPPSGFLFAMATNHAFQTLNNTLNADGGCASAIMDDNYSLGPPRTLAIAHAQFKLDLADVGLELRESKGKAYIAAEYRNDEWAECRGDIPDGVLLDGDDNPVLVDGSPCYGISVCNVPVGSESYIKGYLQQKGVRIRRGFDKVSSLLDSARWPSPDIPTRQMLWILSLACLQFMGDYWLRHCNPSLTSEFAQEIDAGVDDLFELCSGMDTSTWTATAKERFRLPIRFKGCGLRQSDDRRHAQFVGGMLQSSLPLIDRKDAQGNVLPGRFHIPSLVHHFGEDSFSHPLDSPWETLLSHNNNPNSLSGGLRYAWNHLTSNFQSTAPPLQSLTSALLLTQDVSNAGFYASGTYASSVTRALTMEDAFRWPVGHL